VADQAEIHRLVQNKDAKKRKKAAEKLKNNFATLKNKEQAWDDLIKLTQDKKGDVRWGATNPLGACYSHLPEAWVLLHKQGKCAIKISEGMRLITCFDKD